MKKVVISCGPIPAMLDSVKYITNRFKGGLAFKTASELKQRGYEVTIIKWKYTDFNTDGFTVVNVNDVVEYCKWFENNAMNYEAFVMAAAVANLMPSNPYTGKFPSHKYSVGEQFDIKFEIAPRAIDIIKKKNPRCCLIGYKLFDSDDEQLIEAARLTLKESKANVIFANTPSGAKTRKLAILADNSVIEMNFEEHVEFMVRAIESEYFRTEVEKGITTDDVEAAKALVAYFEKERFDKFGTIAFKLPDGSMVTTARGHNGTPVCVYNVDKISRTIRADGKATLNAPLLWEMLKDKEPWTYVIHRHLTDTKAESTKGLDVYQYEFPGTLAEADMYKYVIREDKNCIGFVIDKHGYMLYKHMSDVDWEMYYEMFPEKYFSDPEKIKTWIRKIESDKVLRSKSLEVGGNTSELCTYKCEPNIQGLNNNLSWKELSEIEGYFKVIILRNSINYLSTEELNILKRTLVDGGILIANGFVAAPEVKTTDTEVAIKSGEKIRHYLIINDEITQHEFYSRGEYEYKELGYFTERYSDKSIYIQYQIKRGSKNNG